MELPNRLRVRRKILLAATLQLLAAVFSVLIFLAPNTSDAATVPYMMNFQGRIADNSGNTLANGSYNMKFRLWTLSSGGTNDCTGAKVNCVWEGDRVYGSSDYRVSVTNGLFNIQLGDTTKGDPALTAAMFNALTQGVLYLEVELPTPATATCATNGCAVWTEGAMTPRQALASSPYAINSDNLDGLTSASFGQLTGTNAFSGSNSFSTSTTFSAPTSAGIVLSGTPASGGSQLQIGSALSSGSASGTLIGANGSFSGDLLNLQVGGTSQLKVGNTGNLTLASGASFAVGSSSGITATSCSGGQFLQTQTVAGGIVTATSCATPSGSGADLALDNLASVNIGVPLGFNATQNANLDFITAATAAGNTLLVTGQTAGGTANGGGAITITGGTATTTGTGGLLTLSGGATTATGGDGGVTIDAGSGATAANGIIKIGNNNANTITIGNTSVATTLNLGNGSGANTIAIGNTQIAGSIALGTAMTTGTITLGGAVAQTGADIFDQSTGTNTLELGVGTGATTVQIGTGITNAKAIQIGTGAAVANSITLGGTGANTIAIGNTQIAGSIAIGGALTTGTATFGSLAATNPGTTIVQGGNAASGVGAISIQAATSGLITVGTTNANPITLGGNTTIAANKNLILPSGTGQVQQTYANAATGNAQMLAFSNTNVGAGVAVQGINITPSNASASSGTNTLYGVNFAAGTLGGSNATTNGINFASATGYTNFISSPSAVLTSGGAFTGLTGVALTSGNISTPGNISTSSSGTIASAGTITVGSFATATSTPVCSNGGILATCNSLPSSTSLQQAYANGNTISTTGNDIADTLNSANNFSVSENGTGTSEFEMGTDATPPAQLVLVRNTDITHTAPLGLSVTSAAGGITTAFDASGANITNALAIGANAISGTNFSVTSAGAVTAVGVSAGSGSIQGTGGIAITGASTIAGTLGSVTNLTLSGSVSGGTTYSGSGNINTTGGAIQTNNTTRIDNAGDLTNIGTIASSASLTNGSGVTNAVTNSGASGTNTVIANSVNVSGTSTTGTDSTTGLNFGSFTNPGGTGTNTFTAINGGTGFTNLLTYNGSTSIINGTGQINGAQIQSATVANASLANSGVTVTAGTNLTNGGLVSLGGAITLNVSATPSFTSGTFTANTAALTLGTTNTAQFSVTGSGAQTFSFGTGGTVCTSTTSTCSADYQAAGSYLVQAPAGTANTVTAASGGQDLVLKGTNGTVADLVDIYNTAVTPAIVSSFTSAGAFNTTAAIVAPTSGGTINGLTINAGALTGVTTIATSGAINSATIGAASTFTTSVTSPVLDNAAGLTIGGTAGSLAIGKSGVTATFNGPISSGSNAITGGTITGTSLATSSNGTINSGSGTITSTGNISAGTLEIGSASINTGGGTPTLTDVDYLDSAQTISGAKTLTASTTFSKSGGQGAIFTGTATSGGAILQFGNVAALTGGSANGTYIGSNPAAYTGDFVNLQINGAVKMKVDNTGNETLGGGLTIATGSVVTVGASAGVASTVSCGANQAVTAATFTGGILTTAASCGAITGTGATTTLNNLGTTSINAALIPYANNLVDLGTTALAWNDVYSDNFDTGTITTALTVGTVNAASIQIGRAAVGASIPGGITTSGGTINTGTGNITSTGTVSGTSFSGSGSSLTNVNPTNFETGTGAVTLQSATSTNLSIQATGTGNINLVTAGATAGVAVDPTTNSTTAFEVQNASSVPIFVVDTSTSLSGNYLTNGGFEVGGATPTGWTNIGSAPYVRNTTAPYHYGGQASLEIGTTTANEGASTNTFNSSPPASASTVSFYAEITSGSMSSTDFKVITNGATTAVCNAGVTLNGNGFQRVICPITPAAAVTTLAIETNTAGARTIYIDAVQMITGATPAPATNGAIQLRGAIDSPSDFQSLSNSTTAFQIQNTAGTSNLFDADTLNSRIGIGTLTPGYTLDVAGAANATAYDVGGVGGVASTVSCTANQAVTTATFTGGLLTTAPTCNTITGTGANTTLSNLGTTSINAALLPSGSLALGSTALAWSNVYSANFDTGSGTPALTIGNNNATSITIGKAAFAVSVPGGITTSGGTINTGSGSITSTGTVSGNTFNGSGASLTNLNPTNLVTGTGAVLLQAAGSTNLSLTATGTGAINVSAGTGGIATTIAAGSSATYTNSATMTADQIDQTNTSAANAPTADGINLLQQTFYSKAATGNTDSSTRINVTNSNTVTAGQVNGLRIVATGAGGSVNSNTTGIFIDPLANASTGTTSQNAIQVGSNWNNVLSVNGTSVINGSGQLNGTQIQAATIANAGLANSSITLAAGSNIATLGAVSLGGSITVATTQNPNFTTSVSTPSLDNPGAALAIGAAATTFNLGKAGVTANFSGPISSGTNTITGGTITGSSLATSGNGTINSGSGTISTTGAVNAGTVVATTSVSSPSYTGGGAVTLQAASGSALGLTASGIGAINVTTGTGALNITAGGNVATTIAAGTSATYTNNAVMTADQIDQTNTSAADAPTADGINLLQQTFYGKPAAGNTESSTRINVTDSNAATGGQVNGLRIVATGAGGAINSITDGIYIDPLANSSTGATENALQIQSGWDNILEYNGTTTIVNGTGLVNASQLGQGSGALTLQSAAATALTITGNAASTWSTSAGQLTVQSGNGTVSLGTSTILTASAALTVESTGSNALTLAAGGTTSNVDINPSTTGIVVVGGNTPTVNSASSLTLQSTAAALTLNATGAGAIDITPGTGGIVNTITPASDDTFNEAATAVQSADQIDQSNVSADAPTATGVNLLQQTFFGAAATGNEQSSTRINVTNNNTVTAGQVNALRIVATGPGGAINSITDGIAIDPLANVTTGATQSAVQIGANWTDGLNIASGGNTIAATSATALVVQNAGGAITEFSVDASANNIVHVGSATTDANEVLLQLDSYNAFADAGTCAAATQGALYYNTVTNAIRSCVNSNWEDVVTTSGLGIIMYGVVPDGPTTTGLGDLAGANGYNSGPCKVYLTGTANIIGWNSCTAYSGGRKVLVTAGTATVSATASVYQNLCLTGTNSQPVLYGTANATETTVGLFPTFLVGSPILCLAEIKTATTAGKVADIYDTRAYTTDTKSFATIATTTLALGSMVTIGAAIGEYTPTAATTSPLAGVVVAYSGTISSTLPNAVIVTAGPIAIKNNATGTLGQIIEYGALAGGAGYSTTIADPATTTQPYMYAGVALNTYSGAAAGCTVSTVCNGSTFTNLTIR
jgi:hypothetical protein